MVDYGAPRTSGKKLSISLWCVQQKVAKIVHCGETLAEKTWGTRRSQQCVMWSAFSVSFYSKCVGEPLKRSVRKHEEHESILD